MSDPAAEMSGGLVHEPGPRGETHQSAMAERTQPQGCLERSARGSASSRATRDRAASPADLISVALRVGSQVNSTEPVSAP
jgi:hypothetical protein